MDNNYFKQLNTIDFKDKKEQKGNLTYLSWAYAWGELKNNFPDATYTVYERDQEIEVVTEEHIPEVKQDLEKAIMGNNEMVIKTIKKTVVPVNYFTDGKTCWVKVGVTVNGIEHIEELPVMNNKNQSVPVANITSTEVNKSIQRALTKAIARHGLGLYIYAGEDLPTTPSTLTYSYQEETQANAFNDVKQEVIELITGYFGTNYEAEVDKYIRGAFGATRISETKMEDLDKLIAARDYLISLQSKNL